MKKSFIVVLCICVCAMLLAACGNTPEAANAGAAGNDFMSYNSADWDVATDEQKLAAATELIKQVTPDVEQLSDEDIHTAAEQTVLTINDYFKTTPTGTIYDIAAITQEVLGELTGTQVQER